jgi:DNA-binding NtrC family response regulator
VAPLPESGSVVVGREPSCDIHVDDSTLSRQHVRLHMGETLSIEDLGSRNGTAVVIPDSDPDNPETGATHRLDLKAGERRDIPENSIIRIGSVVLTFEEAADSSVRGTSDVGNVVVREPGMVELYQLATRVANTDMSVLILGESGVGKEVLAQHIHGASERRQAPIVELNCGALPAGLLESELFGHEAGAFTGAKQAKAGLFEVAEGGTVFLDEIGELPLELQVKLLRVLEDRKVTRVGGLQGRRVDIRFIAATNQDLQNAARDGRFRQDLFYRLNGITLRIPPLRERRSEIVPLAEMFLAQYGHSAGFSPESRKMLESYAWPGNVRQLKNVVERATVLCRGGMVQPEHLQLDEVAASTAPAASGASPEELRQQAEELEKRQIIEALEQCAGNQTKAARVLGLTRRALIGRLDKYGIPRPRKGQDS